MLIMSEMLYVVSDFLEKVGTRRREESVNAHVVDSFKPEPEEHFLDINNSPKSVIVPIRGL